MLRKQAAEQKLVAEAGAGPEEERRLKEQLEQQQLQERANMVQQQAD